uniref:hypothetical protein n=1 Tax=Photorhabdus aballayi TaxID=2991723 RepID=UPI0024B5004E|nr:hypothetical protein [Photorhabdus aballayi]
MPKSTLLALSSLVSQTIFCDAFSRFLPLINVSFFLTVGGYSPPILAGLGTGNAACQTRRQSGEGADSLFFLFT